jgi:hypothetical protein
MATIELGRTWRSILSGIQWSIGYDCYNKNKDGLWDNIFAGDRWSSCHTKIGEPRPLICSVKCSEWRCDGTVDWKRSHVRCISPPMTPALGFTPALRFAPSNAQIMTPGEKIFAGDELGALFRPVAVPTCTGDVAARPSLLCRRLAWLWHALSHLTTRRKQWRLSSDRHRP